MSHPKHFEEISDFNYITSSIGNACFSDLTILELWYCVSNSSTREELDAAVKITAELKYLCKAHYKK